MLLVLLVVQMMLVLKAIVRALLAAASEYVYFSPLVCANCVNNYLVH